MAQKQAVKEWLMANNMVEVVDNSPVLSERGRDLLEKFDDIQGDFTLQARELINSLGTPTATTIVAAEPTATKTVAVEPTAATPQSTVDANDPAVVERVRRALSEVADALVPALQAGGELDPRFVGGLVRARR
jgi:hypothetical protein